MVKKAAICLLLLLSFTTVFADSEQFNELTYQYNAEQWVNSITAKVLVTVNAATNTKGMNALQQSIKQKLNKIAKSDWHLTGYHREKDQSGLEAIRMTAQTRLPTNQLTQLRNNAKSISQAGETFTVSAIEYKPSLAEVEHAKTALRQTMLKQITQQVAELNKLYPKQHYFVHKVNFMSSNLVTPMVRTEGAMLAKNQSSQPIATSKLITLRANVEVASKNVVGLSQS